MSQLQHLVCLKLELSLKLPDVFSCTGYTIYRYTTMSEECNNRYGISCIIPVSRRDGDSFTDLLLKKIRNNEIRKTLSDIGSFVFFGCDKILLVLEKSKVFHKYLHYNEIIDFQTYTTKDTISGPGYSIFTTFLATRAGKCIEISQISKIYPY